MSNSWRTILERAAENLSIELSDAPVSIPAPPSHLRRYQRPSSQPLTFAETRDLLARELDAIATADRDMPTAKILQDVRRKRRQAKRRPIAAEPLAMQGASLPPSPPARRSSAGRGLVALVLSVSACALTLYGIYVFLH